MRSLGARVAIWMQAGGCVLLGGSGAALYWSIARTLLADFDANLATSAQAVATLVEEDGGSLGVEFAGNNLPQFDTMGGGEAFVLRDGRDRETARSRSLGTVDLPHRYGAPARPVFFDSIVRGKWFRFAAFRFVPQREDEETGVAARGTLPATEAALLFGRERTSVDRTLLVVRTRLVLAGIATEAVLGMIVAFAVRRGLNPLNLLSARVARINEASLSARLPTAGLPSELEPIASSLNQLLARLEEAFERQRRFTATAAHEFRTPLAELRAAAECRLVSSLEEDENCEAWRDIVAASSRMERLAAALLQLARAEHWRGGMERVRIPVKERLESAWKACERVAGHRGLVWRCDCPEELVFESDPVHFATIMDNLCLNAAKYAPVNSLVVATGCKEGGELRLALRNRAGEIAEADLPRLFERFWRKDAARHDSECHGLGLSIVSEMAHALGGTITAQIEGGDLIFILVLPGASDCAGAGQPIEMRA